MDITPEPDNTSGNRDPCGSVPVSGVLDDSVRRRFPWGVISAIPLFIYGVAPLMFGALGLIFVPAILLGAVSIGRDTTLLKVVGWIWFHLFVTAHGCAMIIAAISFYRLRWRRGVYTIAVGVVVPGISIAAFYFGFIAFGVAR